MGLTRIAVARSTPCAASLCAASLVALGLAGCVAPTAFGEGSGDGESSGEGELVLGGNFERNDVVSNAFFVATDLIDASDVQALLERTPWGGRCFLADERVGGQAFSSVLVQEARAEGVNPLLLLARMQVEKSLISRTSEPTRRNDVDFAFGCGCPDGRACNEAYRGLDRQVACSAQTHMGRYADSRSGAGSWRQGTSKTSLDGYRVTPANHATAALYAYTPHVGLRGGRAVSGNALLHNVLQRFVRHMIALGRITEADLPDARSPWVGSACDASAACELGRDGARCQSSGAAGFCTVACEGYCPDRGGHAPTFCVTLDGTSGTCVAKADPRNDQCARVPGTEARERSRFVGASGAPASRAVVCVPVGASPSEPTPSEPTPSEPTPGEPGPSCDDTCAWPDDGECDDGGADAMYSLCALGTDCSDCGPR